MEVIYNEFDIPELEPVDNLALFLFIGNTQYFLDENYKESVRMNSFAHKIEAATVFVMKAVLEGCSCLSGYRLKYLLGR